MSSQSSVLATIYARLPDDRVLVYDLYSTPVTIGRGIDAEISLPHASVATRHALLAQPAKSLAIEDLGSTLGTELNAVRLEKGELYEVLTGATVKIGDVYLSIVGAGEQHPQWAQKAELKSKSGTPPDGAATFLVAEGIVKQTALEQTAEQISAVSADILEPEDPNPDPEIEKRQVIQAVDTAQISEPVQDSEFAINPTADLSSDDFGLDDPDFSELAITIDPPESSDQFTVVVTNTSELPLTVEINVADQHGKLSYNCNPNLVDLDAGQSASATLDVNLLERSRRRRYPFRVLALVDDLPLAETTAAYIRKPLSVGCLASILGGLALLLLAAFGATAAAFCPTMLDNNCPVDVPVNRLSLLVATPITPEPTLPPPTQLPTAEPITPVPTFTNTAEPEPEPTATLIVTAEPTALPTPTPGERRSFFTYKVVEDDIVSLFSQVDGNGPVALVTGVSDAQVLSATAGDGGKYALNVSEFGAESLWIVDVNGEVLARDIQGDWDVLLDAQWSPDGQWLTVTASSEVDERFFITYDGNSGAVISVPALVAEFPTLTPEPTEIVEESTVAPEATPEGADGADAEATLEPTETEEEG